jgi:hypothetical protein
MANRRLGVVYNVKDYECQGTTLLPSPNSIPPTRETSVNYVQEYRPDFSADVGPAYMETVRPFLDVVEGDVAELWDGEEIKVSRSQWWAELADDVGERGSSGLLG